MHFKHHASSDACNHERITNPARFMQNYRMVASKTTHRLYRTVALSILPQALVVALIRHPDACNVPSVCVFVQLQLA